MMFTGWARVVAEALILFGSAWSSAQQNATLSPVVRQFVKIESPVIALTHVRVIDGTGSPVRENQTIVISGDKIQGIGDSTVTVIPSGAKTLGLTRQRRLVRLGSPAHPRKDGLRCS
jgi:hypothetical protein